MRKPNKLEWRQDADNTWSAIDPRGGWRITITKETKGPCAGLFFHDEGSQRFACNTLAGCKRSVANAFKQALDFTPNR